MHFFFVKVDEEDSYGEPCFTVMACLTQSLIVVLKIGTVTMTGKTPLYDLQLNLGAKIVEYGGYLMPIQFSMGIVKEVLHCRQKAGLFDVSHMAQFGLSLEALVELDSLLTSDLSKLTMGRQIYSVFSNEKGGVIDDVILTHLPSSLLLVSNAACKAKVLQYLTSQLSSSCQLQLLTDRALLSLQGPLASNIISTLCPAAADLTFMTSIETKIASWPCVISRCGYTGEDGFEISMANQHVERLTKQLLQFDGVQPMGLGARDMLRLEAGLPLYGHELSETITPIEAGLRWLVTTNKHYPGADKLNEQRLIGANRHRVALLVDGKIPVREGQELQNEEGETIGYVTSGGFSPTINKPIALALVNSKADKNAVFYAKVRQHQTRLQRTTLPFVPHRYHRD